MRPKILTYHSQRNSGSDYGTNDHEAFAQDLTALLRAKFRVITLWSLTEKLLAGKLTSLPQRCVAITLDDGPVLDVEHDYSSPHGERRSMLAIAESHDRHWLNTLIGQPKVCFTSFVIASETARKEIAGSPDNYLRGDWWASAQRTGRIDIGTHSWNHLHPLVSEVRQHTPYLEGAFHLINDEAEAHKQVIQASQLVRSVTHNRAASLFAYPYGQRNEFLVKDFLPRQCEVIAAFTTEGRPVTQTDNRWEIPRYMCNEHWHSSAELIKILETE